MQRFARYPLLRLLIPFIGGTLLYVYFPERFLSFDLFQHFLFALSIVIVLTICLIIQAYKNINLGITIFIDLALMVFGYELCYFQDLRNYDSFINYHLSENSSQQVLVKPCDIIVHKDNFSRLIVQSYILFDNRTNSFQKVKGKIMLYFPNELKLDNIFHPNRYYLLSTKLKATKSNENPYAFNYTEYLNRQGIFTTAYISSLKKFIPLNIKRKWNIQEWALMVRYTIVEYFKHNKHLSRDAQSIAAALLTGFDDEMDNQVIQSFSHSGTIHILSVSGFHTGLLFLLISFVLNLLDPYKKYRWLRVILVVLLLFFYAFIAGFSPPIVRASIMLSLLVIHQNFYTDRIAHPLNILAASAFLVLLFNPFFINDIGFLLSFSAMIGLAFFSPRYCFDNTILQSVWDIVSMSVGAQLGTLPFVLYFFHGFSFSFIFSNIIIIPLTTIIMFVAILALIPVPYFSIILNTLIHWLITMNQIFDKGYFYYNWFHFTLLDAVFLSIMIIVLRIVIQKIIDYEWHWINLVQFFLLISTIWILSHLFKSLAEMKHQKFSLYIEKNKPVYWIQKNKHIYFNSLDTSALERWAKNLLLKKCIKDYSDISFNYVQLKNKKILIAKDWKDTLLIKRHQPDILIWCIQKFPLIQTFPTSIEKIYWVNNRYIKKNNDVIVLRNGDYIEIE